jgi:hypothetical protein
MSRPRFALGKDPGTHWIRGCVDPGAAIETEAAEKKPFVSDGDINPVVPSVVIHYTN